MAAELVCRYRKLAVLLAVLNRPGPPRDDLTPCFELAVFSTGVVLRSDGQDIEIYTQTCEAHDRLAHSIPGYARSNRMRQPAPS